MFLGHSGREKEPPRFSPFLYLFFVLAFFVVYTFVGIILFALPVSILQSFCDRIGLITCLSFPDIPCCIENPSTYFLITDLFDFKILPLVP